MTDLDAPMTQAAFGDLVGVSQQAISDLQARDVLRDGDSAGAWLLAYCAHLREVAAGRDPDGELSRERARVSRATADKLEMANAATRRELLPVGVLELVLSDLARRIATRLDALVPQIRRAMSDLPASVYARIAVEVAQCRDDCANVNLADADRLSADTDDDQEGEG